VSGQETLSSRRQESLPGRRKAATLLLSLGPETAAQVLKRLMPSEIDELTREVFALERVPEEVADQVIEEGYHMIMAHSYVMSGGIEYAREMLQRALGAEAAREVLVRITHEMQPQPFDFLRQTDPTQLIAFLQNEHPQVIALILAHLPPSSSASILKALPQELSTEVALRIGTMDRTPPEVVQQIERTLQQRLGNLITTDFKRVGGAETLAKLLTSLDRRMEKMILDALEQHDPDVAAEVRRLIFTFEDLELLDDRSLQRLLRDVDMRDLALALRGASDEFQARVFRNISSRAAEMLREDMALTGTVRARVVHEAQQRIVAIARRLEEAEEIYVRRGGDDDVL